MKLTLIVLSHGKQEGKTLEIKLPQFLVGRDAQCHLRPASPLISKRHCAILQKDGKVFVRDFDSTNGTFVNDEPVKGERELFNADQLKIGPILFTVRLDADAPAPSRTPIPPTRAAGATTPAAKPASSTPAPASISKSDEDDIAAMLMSLEDGTLGTAAVGPDGVPEGSTIMEIPVPPELAGENKAGAKPAKPSTSGDTRSAAASILEKMMRRPRT
jgi:predicted component of type VI protein secretion system